MRDALSLLDQAIAFGGGQLAAAEVRTMLGTIDRDAVYRLLQSLAAADAAGLLEEIARVDEFTPDYAALLAELLSVLQRIAIAQLLPDAIDDSHGDRTAVLELAGSLPVEDVQLYYQIGLIGRRDLSLSPQPRGGFEMLLLRMLAFRPATGEQTGGGVRTAVVNPAAGVAVEPSRGCGVATGQAEAPPQGEADSGEWQRIVEQLNLRGITRELALNCALQQAGENAVVLTLDPAHLHLCNDMRTKQIEKALAGHYGRPVKLKIVKAEALTGETPARRQARERELRQQQAVQSIEDDENIKALQETFGATVNYNSIRPRD
jgi:DNA polymerase-3 subunit gamma/tau